MVTLGDYLIVSGILFAIGFAGVMLRRNLIIILMSLELMLNAANLSLVAFSRFRVGPNGLPDYNMQVFVFFVITVAAAEVAVGLCLLLAPFVSAAVITLFTLRWKTLSSSISIAAVLVSFIFSCLIFAQRTSTA